ncbi:MULTISPECIES: M15 family metallopeptidase [unclassified Paenibacillus]|uniref:M15 family metallopeptidase n=1 Tax=unclassified Paenibacillus TaxID=185978 RepID=UPI000955E148|nr:MULTISPECIES: M15 family metallopeptidase [unclassified Paenibacillus]ASS67191.1 M15 family metallopeptidase [Paenibacillus sp. RUD330]SIQ86468.1 D-alanyl-D-alanine carboxypeptidase [Paenibacillus sp. RU4X]SIR07539.1 D-alanyl-D-alanine carboxypeptidase [Paenibacillus sp. RU4T]
MKNRNKRIAAALLLALTAWAAAACSDNSAPGTGAAVNEAAGNAQTASPSPSQEPAANDGNDIGAAPDAGGAANAGGTKDPSGSKGGADKPAGSTGSTDKPAGDKDGQGTAVSGQPSEQVAAQADTVAALINKEFRLPKGYVPDDLVYPDIPFTFSEKIDKRKLRKEAAGALEKLVAGAKKDGISLAGVSGYRSETRQKTLFDNYAKKDGVAAADKYSARPGHSEHQTGLAIDMSGTDGKCAAESCFGGTPEAEWLAAHAADYGFIIRYPEGKESITGYKYEPWHIRFVGKELAVKLAASGDTLEEYYGAAVPVTGRK